MTSQQLQAYRREGRGDFFDPTENLNDFDWRLRAATLWGALSPREHFFSLSNGDPLLTFERFFRDWDDGKENLLFEFWDGRCAAYVGITLGRRKPWGPTYFDYHPDSIIEYRTRDSREPALPTDPEVAYAETAYGKNSSKLSRPQRVLFRKAWEEVIDVVGPRVVPVEEMHGVFGYDS